MHVLLYNICVDQNLLPKADKLLMSRNTVIQMLMCTISIMRCRLFFYPCIIYDCYITQRMLIKLLQVLSTSLSFYVYMYMNGSKGFKENTLMN